MPKILQPVPSDNISAVFKDEDLKKKNFDFQKTVEENHAKREATKHDVPKKKYLILTALLGWCGIHKFYAGQTKAGVLYLLFFWTVLPLGFAIQDLLAGACTTADENGCIRM